MLELLPHPRPTSTTELSNTFWGQKLFAIIYKKAMGQRFNFFPLPPIRLMVPETFTVQVAVCM